MKVLTPTIEITSLTQFHEHEALGKGISYISMAEVEGDVAEFGTFWGGSARILAASMIVDNDKTRKLHLFDSFAGLPPAEHEIDKAAPHDKTGTWHWSFPHHSGPTPDSVKRVCAEFIAVDRLVVYDGWFKDTLPTIPKETKFAMVHLDCDLYQSTYEVLDYLLARGHLSDGCTLFFDDWYCNKGNPKFGQQAAFRDVHEVTRIWEQGSSYTDVGAYGTVGRRFIFHRD